MGASNKADAARQTRKAVLDEAAKHYLTLRGVQMKPLIFFNIVPACRCGAGTL